MEYIYMEWNVDLIQNPNVLMRILKELNIKDKKIKAFKYLGNAYNFKNVLTLKKRDYARYLEIDNLFIIEFTDGSRLEIDYSEGSTLKLGINSLPKDIKSSLSNNVDVNVLFSNCLNEKIIGFNVEMTDSIDNIDFTGSYGIELDENQDSYIKSFSIILTNDIMITFSNYYDYGCININDYNYNQTKINYDELKKGFKGE